MPISASWQDLHRWADDGGIAERPPRIEAKKRASRAYWLRNRSALDDVRRETGRREAFPHRRLEVSR